jgi:hypothetical protein
MELFLMSKKRKQYLMVERAKTERRLPKIFLESCLKIGNKNNSLGWRRNRINLRDT